MTVSMLGINSNLDQNNEKKITNFLP